MKRCQEVTQTRKTTRKCRLPLGHGIGEENLEPIQHRWWCPFWEVIWDAFGNRQFISFRRHS